MPARCGQVVIEHEPFSPPIVVAASGPIAAAPAPRTAGPTDGHMGDKPWLQPIPRAADAGGAGGGDVRCPTACAALPLHACCMHVLRCPTTCNHSFALIPAHVRSRSVATSSVGRASVRRASSCMEGSPPQRWRAPASQAPPMAVARGFRRRARRASSWRRPTWTSTCSTRTRASASLASPPLARASAR